MNKNQQKQQFFACTKTSKRVKIVCFTFWSFFYPQNLFVKKKKINRLEIVLITSFTILLQDNTEVQLLYEKRRCQEENPKNKIIYQKVSYQETS